MGHQLTILWAVWWAVAALLALGLIVLSVQRRRRIARAGDETTQAALPTWRDDLTWSGLVVVGGGAGLGVILGLLVDGHTARGFLAAAIFGLVMLLGLLMLLKNGLAPTDVLRLDAEELAETSAPDAPEGEDVEGPAYGQARSGL